MRESSYISNFKYLLRLIIFLVLVGVIFFYAGEKYKSAADKNVINAFTQKRFEDFYALEPQSLDMVFVGSSHSYCTFNPEIYDAAFGTSSFQLGTPLQHPDTTYYSLLEVFKTQTPKVVVMEIYWDVLDDDFEMKQANSFFEVINNSQTKNEYIKEVFPLSEKVKYALLPIRFQQDYFAYEANAMQKEFEKKHDIKKKQSPQQQGEEYYKSKGYVYCNMPMLPGEYDETNQFKNLFGKDYKPSKVQHEYIEKISALCNKMGSELVLVTAPIANVSMEYIKDYEIINSVVSGIAKDLGAPYVDYNIINQQENLLQNENFRDDAHLNDSGVEIVGDHFLTWLRHNTSFFGND